QICIWRPTALSGPSHRMNYSVLYSSGGCPLASYNLSLLNLLALHIMPYHMNIPYYRFCPFLLDCSHHRIGIGRLLGYRWSSLLAGSILPSCSGDLDGRLWLMPFM